MAKVISSDGLRDFIETGKHQTIENHKAEAKAEPAKEPEAKTDPLKVDPIRAEEAAKLADEKDDGLDAEDADLAEKARLKINKKHREMKAEQALRIKKEELAAESERFAEQQFNERRLVESERDRLKQELADIKSRLPTQADNAPKAPDKNDAKWKNDKGEFEWDRFTEAQADFKVEQFKRQQAQERQAAEQAQITAALDVRVKKAVEKYPDFIEKVGSQDAKDVPPYLMQAMRERELGTDLAYYFATNRDELTRISKLSPIAALAELGRIETRFDVKTEPVKTEVTEPVKTSSAPPPITPINANGAGTVVTDPSRMDFKQLRAFERERRRKET
jgi:hypothetical protein